MTPKLGDMFCIPFNGHFAVGKIIYISQRVNKSFGFVVFDRFFEDENDVAPPETGIVEFRLGDLYTCVTHTKSLIF